MGIKARMAAIIAASTITAVGTVAHATAPTITSSTTLGIPSWTTASVVDDFQSYSAGSKPGAVTNQYGTFDYNVNRVLAGSSLLNASPTNQYLILDSGDFNLNLFGNPSPSITLQTVTLSIVLPTNVTADFFALNSLSQSTRIFLSNTSGADQAYQVTFNQDASSTLKAVHVGGDSGSYTRIIVDNIAAAAPEPSSWAMMIMGFGLAGVGLRRRRVVSSFG